MNHSHLSISNQMVHDIHHHPIELQHNSNMNNDHCMMQMSFHTGLIETILFKPWVTTSIPIFIGSWILIFILGILYEGIREYRQCLEEYSLVKKPILSHGENEGELEQMNTESAKSTPHVEEKISLPYTERLSQSILYTIQLALSYMLMLIVMTFNIYLFLAIILGIGTGHLLYTWIRITSPTNKNERLT